MAWNPSPQVAVARDAAQKLDNADQVIIVWLNHAKGQIGMASYGRTKELCKQAGVLGETAYAAVRDAFCEM